MTNKLYYEDSAILEFEAEVDNRKVTPRGLAVLLNQTAFYPTSGGQPYDTGTLNGIPVIDVWEDDQGDVWHLLQNALADVSVKGQVDKKRRYDHMQQHTGQHLLSASFYNLHNANTIGFHLGKKVSTIDLDIPELSWSSAFHVECAVNSIIWECRPVFINFFTDGEINRIRLRKPPQVTETIRVIQVKDYDASACGGTHVQNTGEVGIIKITGIERYKGGIRVEFLCGNRALLDYQKNLRSLQNAGEILSVARSEVPNATQRLQNELAETRRSLTKLQSVMLSIEAERLWTETSEEHGVRWLVYHWTNRTFDETRRIAQLLREKQRTLLFFAVTEGKAVRLLCARSDDLPSVDARLILNTALENLGGRGGGSPYLAQGGSQYTSEEDISSVLKAVRQFAIQTLTKNSGG